jgi:hypothetical protein
VATFRFSRRAEADLVGIGGYTLRTWGVDHPDPGQRSSLPRPDQGRRGRTRGVNLKLRGEGYCGREKGISTTDC